jgi:CheY-like chemotaxis protein
MNQKVIAAMLKTLGYDSDTADDGYEAYQKAIKQKYDLIIVDMIMPKMDGIESSKLIIENDKDALIVAISATNDPEMIERAKLAGIKEFLPKPVRIEDLKRLFAKYF